MKEFVFAATLLTVAIGVVPGAHACSGSTDAISPHRTDLQDGHKQAVSEPDITVLVGLLLGLILANPTTAAIPCPECADAR